MAVDGMGGGTNLLACTCRGPAFQRNRAGGFYFGRLFPGLLNAGLSRESRDAGDKQCGR